MNEDVPRWLLAWTLGMTLSVGLLSSAVACFSLNDGERRLKPRSHLRLKWIFGLMADYETLIAVLHTGGLAGLGWAAYAGYELGFCLAPPWAALAGVAMALTGSLVGAVALPRLLGGYFPLQTLHVFAPLTLVAYGALFVPVRWMRPWLKRLYLSPLFEDSSGAAPNPQEKMLKALVGLEEITVKAVMRSRLEINAIPLDAGAEDLISAFHRTGNSRLVVYDKTLDEVKGVAYAKDCIPLLENPAAFDWKTSLRPPFFVPEYVKLNKLLQEFRVRKLHFAIVVDEFGGTAGIVTLEDVLEEIFGEINDEYDKSVGGYTKLSKDEFVFPGRTSLMDVCRFADLPDDVFDEVKGDSETLAGLILELNGGFPRKGQTLTLDGFVFTVETVIPTAVTRIKMKIRR